MGYCGIEEPKEVIAEEISVLWEPAHFAVFAIRSYFEREILVPPWGQSDCSGMAQTICAKDFSKTETFKTSW